MDHAIVHRRIASAFADLSAGRIEANTEELSAAAVHDFVGTLIATRGTAEALANPVTS